MQRRNAQINGEATIKDRRVRSHSRMEWKEGRHHDATGRERTNTPKAQKDKNLTNTYKPRTRCTIKPRTRRPPCRRPPPHTTPAAPNAATYKATGKQPEQIAA
jgi:hypothetical protein